MRKVGVVMGAAFVAGVAAMAVVQAQAPAAPKPAAGTAQTAPAGRAGGAAAARSRVHGDLNQVMRGILFPSSNVLFAAQNTEEFAAIKQDKDPSLATDPLRSVYNGWTAVENAGLALAESANLLMIPGRVCSNGKPVPVNNADWAKFVAGLRDAGMEAAKAARAKNGDAMIDVADRMTTACSECHDVYREKTDAQGGVAARCTK